MIPGGDSIGIELDYPGVLITGGYEIEINDQYYNPLDDDFKIGDLIVALNEQEISDLEQLSNLLKESNNNHQYKVTIMRDKKKLEKDLKVAYEDQQFSTGLYVKDSISGIGTLTFYNPETKTFGALGHAMTETKLNSESLLQNGQIYQSTITSIKKAKPGNSGNKIADISNVQIGSINSHNSFGIYGTYNYDLTSRKVMETAKIEEITLGPAYFLTVLENDQIVACQIEITKLNPQSTVSEKGIEFSLTDQSVIEKTNGIIQGMSGSPIIQNDKLLGAVTHVLVNDSTKGYGIFIDNMLDAAG